MGNNLVVYGVVFGDRFVVFKVVFDGKVLGWALGMCLHEMEGVSLDRGCVVEGCYRDDSIQDAVT